MGNEHNANDHEKPYQLNVSTAAIYAGMATLVLASLIDIYSSLVRNPVDELDELKAEFRQHLKECDARLKKIEGEHLLFDFRFKQNHHKKHPE